MKISAKIFPWENPLLFDSGSWKLEIGDVVIVNIDSEIESGIVEKINVRSKKEAPNIIRKASLIDIEKIEKNQEKNKDAIDICRNLISEMKLEMKVINVHFSFDGGKIVFPFISERRVDFRDLIKNLSKKFQRSIRLQQIGSRDEARNKGGFGICGRELCCVKFSGNLTSVTMDDAKVQQMGQLRGERLSGLCGRLKCCLGFESEQYRKKLVKMPKLGEIVMSAGKKGKVIKLDVLATEIVIEFEDKSKKKIHISELKSYKV